MKWVGLGRGGSGFVRAYVHNRGRYEPRARASRVTLTYLEFSYDIKSERDTLFSSKKDQE